MNALKNYSLLCILLALTILTGCGKKAMPQPKDSKEYFAWKNSVATSSGDCINISAELSGAIRNIDGILLEVEPVGANNTCYECPFLPTERQSYNYDNVVLDGKRYQIAMTFCPETKSPAYRWRLVGRNVFRTFPYAMTPVHLLVPAVTEEQPEKSTSKK